MASKFRNKERGSDWKDPTQSKIYRFFDWIWKLFVLNTLTIITCIGIITILPAFCAAFRTIKQCYEEDETHFVKKYYQNFVFCFKDTVLMGLLILVIYAVLFYAYVYYSEIIRMLQESQEYNTYLNVYSILLGIIILLFLIVTIVVIQIPVAVTYFHLRFFDKIKFAFYVTFKHFGITLCLFLVMSINGMAMILWPPYIMVVSFTLPIYIMYLLTRRPYWAIANNMEYEEEEDEFDLKNNSNVREDYEDDKLSKQEAEDSLEKLNKRIMEGKIDD